MAVCSVDGESRPLPQSQGLSLDDLKPATRIGRFVVQGHGEGATLEGQEAAGKLDRPTRIEVAEIALESRHRNSFDATVNARRKAGLDKVVPLGALAVGIDVPQFRRPQARLPQGWIAWLGRPVPRSVGGACSVTPAATPSTSA